MSKFVNRYRHGRYVVDRYQFASGGESDVLAFDFVNDYAQGFGVPAKSMYIENHGGGNGYNYLYFNLSTDGHQWDKMYTLQSDRFQTYAPEDGVIIYGLKVWSSNANCRFSMVATPGIWTSFEYNAYTSKPTYDLKKDRLTFSEVMI